MYSYKSLLVVLVFILSGCGNIQILPDGAVENTIRAGKEIYDESKIKSSGGEKRSFSSMVKMSDFETQKDAEISCLNGLKERSVSISKNMQLISESTSIVDEKSSAAIKCELIAYIWPNK